MFDILKTDWEGLQDSEYLFSCDSVRKFVVISGSELEDSISDSSSIQLMFDISTGLPFYYCERIPGYHDIREEDLEIPKGFQAEITHIKTQRGRKFTDVLIATETYFKAFDSVYNRRSLPGDKHS